ncbi:MAG: ABC transporter ATP-binding protein [Limnothrix sp. RL_2_0]|nr:ABC transporter ATP-binding protein [Limnothrix sp. RL_2_0]
MSDTIIKVENLGKKYTIGHQAQSGGWKPNRGNYVALRDVVTDSAKSLGKRLLGKERKPSYTTEDFWALKDINFEIKRGEVVGIIGRNGAGKSTLLKILSRITEPTTGRIELRGRVASLLEVGTGFHPELTGRENIYLNGSILGMSRIEIRKKFDEIVDFAEVEKFLDTPVKRYSSGMYVRLAFAVAAHLEPEILVIDEVLAVGDIDFQKKCLRKMNGIARENTTILLVSHNVSIVQDLCNQSILLEQGKVRTLGSTKNVIETYLENSSRNTQLLTHTSEAKRKGNKKIVFKDAYITNQLEEYQNIFYMGDSIYLHFSFVIREVVSKPIVAIHIKNSLNEQFCHITNLDDDFEIPNSRVGDNININVEVAKVFFTPSEYIIELWIGENLGVTCDYLKDFITIEILQGNKIKRPIPYPSHVKFFLESHWHIKDDVEKLD